MFVSALRKTKCGGFSPLPSTYQKKFEANSLQEEGFRKVGEEGWHSVGEF